MSDVHTSAGLTKCQQCMQALHHISSQLQFITKMMVSEDDTVYASCCLHESSVHLIAVSEGGGRAARGCSWAAADRCATICQAIVCGSIIPCYHEHLQTAPVSQAVAIVIVGVCMPAKHHTMRTKADCEHDNIAPFVALLHVVHRPHTMMMLGQLVG